MTLFSLFISYLMTECKPSAKQLNEQLLHFKHLLQLPGLIEEILSIVQSVKTQMEFEERQYHLIQEKQLIVNEKIIDACRILAKNVQNEKRIALLLNRKQSPLAGLTNLYDSQRLTKSQQQLLSISRLYDNLTERICLFEKRIERCIAAEISNFEDISKKGAKYADITTQQLRNIARKRFVKSIERIAYIRKSEKQRHNFK